MEVAHMHRFIADMHFFTVPSYMMAAPGTAVTVSRGCICVAPLGEATVMRGHLEDGKQVRARDSNSLLEHGALPFALMHRTDCHD